MKKLLLLILASLQLVCFGIPVRVNIIARGGVPVTLMADYDERTNTAVTPFRYINQCLSIFLQPIPNQPSAIREIPGQPGLFEFADPISIDNIDPTILQQAITLVTIHDNEQLSEQERLALDINNLDQQQVTQLINVYDFLGAPQENIDLLINRSVELAIQLPIGCPFARAGENIITLQNEENIASARRRLSQHFAAEVLCHNAWTSISIELAGHRGFVNSVAWSPDGAHVCMSSDTCETK